MSEPSEPAGPPLARLFALAYRSLIDGLHEELRAEGWDDVRPAYGFVLLTVRERPMTSTALAVLLGTTKQATSKLVEHMQGAGYVSRVGASDGRQRPVQLTARGVDLLEAVERIYRRLEQGWAEVIGVDDLERVRTALTAVLTQDTGGHLPAIRPTP